MALKSETVLKMHELLPRMTTDQLTAINQAAVEELRHRHRRERALKTAENIGRIEKGSRVRLAYNMKPKYLSGQAGVVTSIEKGDVAVIRLDLGPQGKFRTGIVHVKFSALTLEETA